MANNATDAYLAQLPIRGVPGRHLNTAIGRVDTRDLFANFDLQLAIRLYKEGDKCGALKILGRGSHSIQDKIAHGAWPLYWGPHPAWMDDALQRPIELRATEIATREYFGLFLRGISQ